MTVWRGYALETFGINLCILFAAEGRFLHTLIPDESLRQFSLLKSLRLAAWLLSFPAEVCLKINK